MIQKDWNSLLGSQSNDFTFIYDADTQHYLKFFFQNEHEIKLTQGVSLIMPKEGIQHIKEDIIPTEYIANYSPLLKGFIEADNKTILITEETIFNLLIKEEKRLAFLKFLKNNNKKLVFFHNNEQLHNNYLKNSHIPNSRAITIEDIQEQITVMENLEDTIKTLDMHINPFKEPELAYQQLLNKET